MLVLNASQSTFSGSFYSTTTIPGTFNAASAILRIVSTVNEKSTDVPVTISNIDSNSIEFTGSSADLPTGVVQGTVSIFRVTTNRPVWGDRHELWGSTHRRWGGTLDSASEILIGTDDIRILN